MSETVDPLTRYLETLRDLADALSSSEADLDCFFLHRDRAFVHMLLMIEQRLAKIENLCGTCVLAENGLDGARIQRLLVAPGERNSAIREVRSFTKHAKKLIVIDPYLYGEQKKDAEKFAADFARAARFHGRDLKEVHLLYSSKHGKTNAVRKALRKCASDASVVLTDSDTSDIHDRIWIADRTRALVVGNSFGGLGRERASFLLELPGSDLLRLLSFLDDNGYLR